MKKCRILFIVLLALLQHLAGTASANDNIRQSDFNAGYTAATTLPAGEPDIVHTVLLHGNYHVGRQVQHDAFIVAGSFFHHTFLAYKLCYCVTGHVSFKRYLDHLYPTHHFW